MNEKVAIAPGRIGKLLKEGLAGHHPLFTPGEIRAAFAHGEEEHPVDEAEAAAVGEALLAMARGPLADAAQAVARLSPAAREALIRLYFRLLDRARALEGGTLQ